MHALERGQNFSSGIARELRKIAEGFYTRLIVRKDDRHAGLHRFLHRADERRLGGRVDEQDVDALRQKVTTDIATKGGQYDIMTIGTYEVPIWGKQGWLASLNDLPPDYDVDDLLPAIRGGLTVDGTLYAAPFYGESSMVMYRTDLMEAAGLAPYERIDVYDVTNGSRFSTYLIEGSRHSGVICVNGAAAHLAKAGDRIIITGYGLATEAEIRSHRPRVVLVDERNRIRQVLHESAGALVP
mgnify:CR=1 FL=1